LIRTPPPVRHPGSSQARLDSPKMLISRAIAVQL